MGQFEHSRGSNHGPSRSGFCRFSCASRGISTVLVVAIDASLLKLCRLSWSRRSSFSRRSCPISLVYVIVAPNWNCRASDVLLTDSNVSITRRIGALIGMPSLLAILAWLASTTFHFSSVAYLATKSYEWSRLSLLLRFGVRRDLRYTSWVGCRRLEQSLSFAWWL